MGDGWSAPRRETISSTANPQVKRIRALAQRKERERSGLFFAEGIRIVAEALDCDLEIETLVVAPDLLTSTFARETATRAAERGIPVLDVTPAVFESLSRKEGPQGLGAVARARWTDLDTVHLAPGKRQEGRAASSLWLALDTPQDPGNVGTILRTCDATGVDGLVLIGPSADPYDPAALRASMGAAFTVPLARASWEQLVAWAHREGLPLIGAAGSSATGYREARYPARMVLLMGSEREGLSSAQLAACSQLVSIPMVGRSDSLNLAVATAVILYEVFARGEHAPTAR